MSDSFPASARDPEYRSIEEKASEWFGRCELGLTPEQEREFVQWLEADPRHGEAMREMDETWDFLDRLQEIRPPQRVSAPARNRSTGRVRAFLAAAAVVGILFAGAWQWTSARGERLVRQVATEAGGMKKIELPDGSAVYLNASSQVEVLFSRRERRVQLQRGEAHFAVAKDPARPFVVTAGEVSVRAIGTAFDVRREARAVEVFVAEGQVRIDATTKGGSLLTRAEGTPTPATPIVDGAELLVAGQRVIVPLNADATPRPARVEPIAAERIQEALAWRTRQLDFDLTPLADVVAEFNRYNAHQLVIADQELGRQTFGGSFRADNYRVFVQLLEQRFGVIAEREADRTVLRRAK